MDLEVRRLGLGARVNTLSISDLAGVQQCCRDIPELIQPHLFWIWKPDARTLTLIRRPPKGELPKTIDFLGMVVPILMSKSIIHK